MRWRCNGNVCLGKVTSYDFGDGTYYMSFLSRYTRHSKQPACLNSYTHEMGRIAVSSLRTPGPATLPCECADSPGVVPTRLASTDLRAECNFQAWGSMLVERHGLWSTLCGKRDFANTSWLLASACLLGVPCLVNTSVFEGIARW